MSAIAQRLREAADAVEALEARGHQIEAVDLDNLVKPRILVRSTKACDGMGGVPYRHMGGAPVYAAPFMGCQIEWKGNH